MSPDQRSQRPQRIERETLSSSTWDLHDQSHLRHLVLPGKSLLSTLELLQSYQTVLQADMNLARLFHIPLTSDLKADGLDTLFSKRRPHVLEADPAGCTIHWADVVLSATYDPKQQSDGNHHARVDKCKALVEVSKEDHDFIATGLPRQLVDPHSYPCDVASEINIVKLTRSQIAPWKDLTLQLNQTIDNVLAGLSGRVEKLQQKYLKFGLQGNSSDEFTRSGSEASITPKNSDGSPLAKQGKKRKGQNHSWTPEEARDLPGWFKQHQNLSEKEITEQYLLFSGQDRSYPSLQAQLYKQGFGYLCNKKKPSHGQRAASQLPPSAPALSATRECNDPTQFSVAMNIISRSLYPFQQQSSGTQTVENEIELGRSPSRNAQKGRSSSEKAESDPELAVEPNCPCLNVTRPGSYGHSSAVEVISVSTNKTVGRSKESLAAASPGLQPSVSQCRSEFDCTDELQESLLEPADRPDSSSQSPVQSNPDEHIGVRPESLLPAESCDGITHGRSPALCPNSTVDAISLTIAPHSRITTDHACRTEACSKEKQTPRHENGSKDVDFSPSLSQKLSFEFANHQVQLRVATENSLSKETEECDFQTAGHRIGAQQETGITGKANHPVSETLSNNEVGALHNLESGTFFSPTKETPNGDREIDVATELDLAIGIRGKPASTDGQKDARYGSDWQHCRDINNSAGQVAPLTSMDRQPGNDVQAMGSAGKTQLTDIFALQPAGEISNEVTHRTMASAPAAGTPQDDPQAIVEPKIQPKTTRKRAFGHRTKTGCVTCRQRKKKCDEQKPSCGNCMRAGYRCEGYKKPTHWQNAIAPAMTVPAGSSETNTEVSAYDQFLSTEHSPVPEMDLTVVHPNPSSIQQSIRRTNSEVGSIAWLSNGPRSIRRDPSSVCSTGPCDQQPLSTYLAPPLSRPVRKDWTIPSIYEVLQGSGVGNSIPFVSRSSRE